MNEKAAVEDFERKVYRVESVQPCGHSLALNQLRACKTQEIKILAKSESALISGGYIG